MQRKSEKYATCDTGPIEFTFIISMTLNIGHRNHEKEMNVENKMFIYVILTFMKKHKNERLILCICDLNILFCSNYFLISSTIINIYHDTLN